MYTERMEAESSKAFSLRLSALSIIRKQIFYHLKINFHAFCLLTLNISKLQFFILLCLNMTTVIAALKGFEAS